MPQTFNVGARSRFVTITAWVVIVFAAVGAVEAAVHHATLMSLAPRGSGLPPVSGLVVRHLPWFTGAGFALSLATLGCAVGLLLRLDWARRIFIGLLALAITANLGGLWIQHEVVHSVVTATLSVAPLPPQALDVFGGFVTAARALAAAMTLAACVLLGWMIRRLMSPSVRQEFA
jgi:hypothetical protein